MKLRTKFDTIEQLGVVYSTLVVKKKKHNAKGKTKRIFGAVNRTRKAADERNCRTKGCNEFFRKRPEKIEACSKFEYIFQFKQKNFESQLKKDYSVKKLCKVLTVSETGFYKWKRNRNKPKAWQILLQKIYEILDEHPDNHNYGIDRIFAGFESKR